MARRTLSSTWKHFERLHRQYEKSDFADAAKLGEIDELVQKVNESRIVDALATLFVHPYGLEEYSLRFAGSEDGHAPEWITRHDNEQKAIDVSVEGVFQFAAECEAAVEALKTPEARKTFQHYRYQAYLAELSKLPSRYILFLLILREVAEARKITDVEKKGGEIEVATGKAYLQLLWAFKELEIFFRRTNGLDLRAETGILWLESDWFIGK
jgi:hypothetical protein